MPKSWLDIHVEGREKAQEIIATFDLASQVIDWKKRFIPVVVQGIRQRCESIKQPINSPISTKGNKVTVIANIVDKNDEYYTEAIEILNDDFAAVEEQAKGYDFPVCIRWKRSSDGQTSYWSPRGVSFMPHWYNALGGATPGAGAPTKAEQLKKRQIGVQLPVWMIAKLDEMKPKTRQAIIEKALLEKFGWKPPLIIKPSC
jgi:hypothetical protein